MMTTVFKNLSHSKHAMISGFWWWWSMRQGFPFDCFCRLEGDFCICLVGLFPCSNLARFASLEYDTRSVIWMQIWFSRSHRSPIYEFCRHRLEIHARILVLVIWFTSVCFVSFPTKRISSQFGFDKVIFSTIPRRNSWVKTTLLLHMQSWRRCYAEDRYVVPLITKLKFSWNWR